MERHGKDQVSERSPDDTFEVVIMTKNEETPFD
jgi:hypothetical protein